MKLTVLALLIFGLVPHASLAQTLPSWQTYSYQVIKITDGDTLTATDGNLRFKVRLAGMDSPEARQDYGKSAGFALKELLLDKKIQIKPVGSGVEAYGRVLGQVYLDGRDVAVELIERGLATYYRPKCADYPADKKLYDYDPRPYVEAESKARAAKKNIWVFDGFQLPCAYRKAHKK